MFVYLRCQCASSTQVLPLQLFPHWGGNFVGSRPSLAGLDSEKMMIALEGGLLTEHEVVGLSQLIREPDVRGLSCLIILNALCLSFLNSRIFSKSLVYPSTRWSVS